MRFPKVSTATRNANGIPTNYTEVEYIESTGTQWIDTGVIPTKNIGASMRFYITGQGPSGGDSCMLMSGGDAPGYRWGYSYRVVGGTLQVSGLMKSGISWENYGMTINTAHTVDYNFTNQADCYLDGTLIRSDIPGGDISKNNTIYLFCSNDGTGTIWRPGKFKVYYLKMVDCGKVIRDFVPVLDENNKPGLYEKISGTMYYNQASSGNDFSYGKKITYIDYLQSSGTQYIDTGFMPNNNTKVDLVGKFNTTYPCCLWSTRWSQSPDYDTYGAYAENNSQGMLYVYCGKYSSGNFVGVSNAEFPHRDGNFIRFIQDRNKVDFTNLGTGANWTYTFAEETFQSTRNLALFYFSSSSAFATRGGYIKSCKIYDNGIMVRDFVAVRDEDNVGYMFDKMGHQLYANAGSGTFTLGDDIVPKTTTKLIKTKSTISGLPGNYTEVEYLENTGSSYIDTGFIGNQNTRIKIDLKLINTTEIRAIFGSRTYNGSSITGAKYFYPITSGSPVPVDKFQFGYAGALYRVENITNPGDIYSIDLDKNVVKLNNVVQNTFTPTTYTNPSTILLFNCHTGASGTELDDRYGLCRIYSCKIWDNGTLVRDYIPALDASGKPCLYDKVNSKPYYNQGTGEFSYGKQIIPVEYLQADGNQYINTNYKPTNTTGIYAKIQYVNTTSADYVAVGTWLSNNRFVAPFRGSATTLRWYSGWGSLEPNAGNAINTDVNEIYLNYNNDRKILVRTYDYDTVISSNITNISGNWKPLFIFSRNLDGTPSGNMVGKIFNVKFTEGTNLVRDYIPVKDEDGNGYMFDKLTHSMCGNSGTGSFTLGNEKKTYKTRIIKSDVVPNEYTRLKCLTSSGTQYIDTGVTAKSGLSTSLTFEYTALSSTSISMLDARSGDARIYFCHCGNVSGYWFYYGYGAAVQTSFTPVTNTKYTVETSLSAGSQTMKVNGTTIASGSSSSSYNIGVNLYMFGANYSTPQYLAKAKLYCCKIWDDNGKLVRNFVPALRNSDNKPGMWDRVTKTFYTNAGSGEFTYETL